MKKECKVIVLPTNHKDTAYVYIVSEDAKVELNDWVYNSISIHKSTNSHVYQITEEKQFPALNIRKVIASTDTLIIPEINGTDHLPGIPQKFIDKYFEASVDRVMIEFTNRCCGRCIENVDECVTDMTCMLHKTTGCEICWGATGDLTAVDDNYKVKDYAFIFPKVYSREYVESLIYKYADEEWAGLSSKSDIRNVNEWIKENLK